jgi:benzoyl-CoA reductase/2-hydroxyglutaryl-CoA dehydratase subunit BcrC/BadD/HgdB
MYYDNVLKLCGYEPEEIEEQRRRLEKAFEKLQFTPEDFKRAEGRVSEYFDIELTGIRKMLGLYLQSLIDVILAREEGKKLVYTMMPPMVIVQNAMAMVSKDVYVTAPDILLSYTHGAIFGNLTPILESAEADLLPLASCYCGGVKANLGAISEGVIPLPDLFIASGFVCDQTPKVDEILGERYNIPVVYIDGTLDEEKMNWEKTTDRRVEYLVQESKDALAKFQEVTGCIVTDEMVQEANSRARDLRKRCKKIADLIRDADPALIGFDSVAALFRAANWVVNPTTYGKTEKIIELCYTELKERADRGEGVVAKGAPRVAVYKVCGDPVVVRGIEKAGLAVIADNTGIMGPKKEEFRSEYEDFWYQGIELFIRMGVGYPSRQVEFFKDLNIDGVIYNYPVGCRDQCISPVKVRDILTKELGIPVLLLEFDHVETRLYSAESIMSRVEPFAEMLKRNKAAKAEKGHGT